MSNTYIIGGLGFVGGAMARAFDGSKIIDVADPATMSLYAEMRTGDVAFVCVPTPYDPVNDAFDTSAVRDVLPRIPLGVTACVRSTTTFALDRADVVHPEFLRAAHADEDFRAAKVRVYGVRDDRRDHVDVIERVYLDAGIVAAIIIVGPDEACALKLMHNAWCAVNVALANEFAAYCEQDDRTSWEDIRGHLVHLLEANGKSFRAYSRVPGPDGRRGFGGTCFPKDMAALRGCMWPLDNVIEGALRTNARVRLPE